MSLPLKKRGRDEREEEVNEQRRDTKKPRNLTLRTSPTTKHTFSFLKSPSSMPLPKPLTITPVESSEDEDDHFTSLSPRSRTSSQRYMNHNISFPDDVDSDLEMTDSQPSASPLPWRTTFLGSAISPRPPPINLPPRTPYHNSIHGARIPTPIYGHFNPEDTLMDTSDCPQSSTSPQTQQQLAHEIFLRRRRLPSPISEDEAMMESSVNVAGGMLNRLEMSTKQTPPKPTFSRIKGWELKDGVEGGKVTLSMGYRASCEKCRKQVPGHYNHIVRG